MKRLEEEVRGFDTKEKTFDMFDYKKIIEFQTEPPILSENDIKPKKWIYIISNPQYSGKYKVGIASNINQRLHAYQTSDPNRAYKLEYKIKTANFLEIERSIHKYFDAEYEWVKAELKDIIEKIKSSVNP